MKYFNHPDRLIITLILLLAGWGMYIPVSAAVQANENTPTKHRLSLKLPNKNGVSYVYFSSSSYYGQWSEENSTEIEEGEYIYVGFSLNNNYICKSVSINGMEILNNTSYYYFDFTMPGYDTEITIDTEFNPNSPSDPQVSIVKPKRNLYLNSNPVGAATNYGAGKYSPGESIYVSTNGNSGYKFLGWSKDGEIINNNTAFYFTMPESDVSLTANYIYDPSDPQEPQTPTLQHPLTVIASPAEAGYFNITQTKITCGKEYSINAYPNTGYKFKGWIVNGEPQSETGTNLRKVMTDAGAQIVGLFIYDPESPANPQPNFFDPTTGQLIIDDFKPGNLEYTIGYTINNKYDNVSNLIIRGEMTEDDFYCLSYLSNILTIDMSHVNYSDLVPDYGFMYSNAANIILPSTTTQIGANAFSDVTNLKTLILYSHIPPACSENSFKNFTGISECTLYVPEEAIEKYESNKYWQKFIIKPIKNEANLLFSTPDDPKSWNNLSIPHRISIEGEYFSSIGQGSRIEYSVENSETWTIVAEGLESGNIFKATITAIFNKELPYHTINFRIVDNNGNITLLDPIIYKNINNIEIRNIENKYYDWGNPIYQDKIECDLPDGHYTISDYRNNINAGIASFDIEGVYPYTIGKKEVKFNISPLSLSGEIVFTNDENYTYTGEPITPEWRFTDEALNSLTFSTDYDIKWHNNIIPGDASLEVFGINNFTGSLSASFPIKKSDLKSDAYSVELPSQDITFDNNIHSAITTQKEGVGEIKVYYSLSGSEEMMSEAPLSIGDYDVYIEISDGDLFLGIPLTKVGSFSIYEFDENEWQILQKATNTLIENGWETPWNLSPGKSVISSLNGIKLNSGHITEINLEGRGLYGSFPIELLSFEKLKTLNLANNNFTNDIDSSVISNHVAREKVSEIENINIANNYFSGNIGIFAAAFPSLKTLNAVNNRLSEVVPMISSNVKNLFLEGQKIDKTITLDLTTPNTENLVSQIPTILIYNHLNQNYSKPLKLRCSTDDDWAVLITFSDNQLNVIPASDEKTFRGNSGDTLKAFALSDDNRFAEHSLSFKMLFNIGDTNFDTKVNILDLQTIILYAFDEYNDYLFNFTAADTYRDNRINVQDVICEANLLLSNNQNTYSQKLKSVSPETMSTNDAFVYIEDNEIYINSPVEIAAIDLTIAGKAVWEMDLYGFDMVSTDNHLIAFSLAGHAIPAGVSKIGTSQTSGKILSCFLSDKIAHTIPTTISQVTDIDATVNSESEDTTFFDINGIHHAKPNNKINIIKTGNTVSKVLISNN